jgi:hypothetical protein
MTEASSGRLTPAILRHWILGAALLIVLAFGLLKAIRTASAEIMLIEVRAILSDWGNSNTMPVLADWTNLHERLEAIMQLVTGDPEHYRFLGLIYEWRFFLDDSPVETEVDIIAFREAAIAAYRKSSILRPAWPVDWANLAKQKVMLGQEDEEFLLALERAMKLGPNETLVRLMVTEIITLAWPYLQSIPATQVKALQMLETSLQPPQSSDTAQHLALIIERNMLPELCPLFAIDRLAEWPQQACNAALSQNIPQ